jgi:hypothetical protein
MKTEIYPLMKAGFSYDYLPPYVREAENVDAEEDRDAEDDHVEDAHFEDDHVEEEDHVREPVGQCYEVNDGQMDDDKTEGNEEDTDDEEVVFEDVPDIDGEITQSGMYILYNY